MISLFIIENNTIRYGMTYLRAFKSRQKASLVYSARHRNKKN